MNKPQFHTPYLLSAIEYFEDFPDFQVRPVYMTKRDGNKCTVAIYNDDMTEELDSFAWISIYKLEPYSLDRAEEIEFELQELINKWDEEHS